MNSFKKLCTVINSAEYKVQFLENGRLSNDFLVAHPSAQGWERVEAGHLAQ